MGGRPLDDTAVPRGEVPAFDRIAIQETFLSEYGDIIEYSDLYEYWFYEPDAIDQLVEHAENNIMHDNARKELRKFIEAEVTER